MRCSIVVVLAVVAGACGGTAEEQERPAAAATEAATTEAATTATDTAPEAVGGTLRVAMVDWVRHEQANTSPDGKAHYALDPQQAFYPPSWELFRCCLLRTLLSYNGRPTAEGGAEVRPDLAEGLPEVSADGRTWTFKIKPGLRYAPPYEDTEIVAGDFVRALERVFRPANPSWTEATGIPFLGHYFFFYIDLIEGAREFADGNAGSIDGLETPDDHTLVVHLTRAAGDLGARFAMPATAPIPPGAADGHDDGYGPFLVASGPYMIERYLPGSSLTLVRNPSWDPATDELRGAYADRIEIGFGGDAEGAYAKVETSELDLVLDEPPSSELARRYLSDPELEGQLSVYPTDAAWYIAFTIAAPPFDDLHVRKAVNLAVDKRELRELQGGPLAGAVATHVASDSLENNLLLDYDPYATPGHEGDLGAAGAEMALSSYDRDGDGVCDDSACARVRLIVRNEPPFPRLAASLERSLEPLGISLEVEAVDDIYAVITRPEEQVPIAIGLAWGKDFPGGSSWFEPLFSSSSIPDPNNSLVGASADQLEEWGYSATAVPGVDEKIAECEVLVGSAQFACWAELDQLLMEDVVPWVPYLSTTEARAVSSRVSSFSVDAAFTMPALDRIALEPGS